MAPHTPLENAAGWRLSLSVDEGKAGPAGALSQLVSGASPGGGLTLTHTLFRADVTVAKGIGLDGGRVRIVLERMPFRLVQDILAAYESARTRTTPSGAQESLTGALHLFWRMGLPYPGLADAADLLGAATGVDDAQLAARFTVTNLSVEVDRASYSLVIEGVDRAWHRLSTEKVDAATPLARPADVAALCEQIGVASDGAGGTAGHALSAAREVAASLPGAPPSDAGASIVTPRERVLNRLREFESTVVDDAGAGGLGGYLIDNGRLVFGKSVVAAYTAQAHDLNGGASVIEARAHARDLTDTSGAMEGFSLKVRGDVSIKPGGVVRFRRPTQNVTSPSTGLGYADAVAGLATNPLDLSADGDVVLLHVRSVRHRQAASVGFVTEIDGVACDAPTVPALASLPASGAAAGSAEAAAGVIQAAIQRQAPRVVDVGEVRAFRAQGSGDGPRQTSDLILGLDPAVGRVQSLRTVDVVREHPQRATGAPYVTPFAWGPYGLVLPRYPGARVALVRPEGKPEEALDIGSLWWSGPGNAEPGPAVAEEGDYWLILPVDPAPMTGAPDDASELPVDAAGATHDLTDSGGRRTLQLRELTVRVGEWAIGGPGDRPEPPPSPGGLRIEGKDGGAVIEIGENGAIRITTPQTLELSADAGITLKTNGVTVEIKDGVMDVK